MIDVYKLIIENINVCQGQIYNVGGGFENTLSLLELISIIESKLNKKINYNFSTWRPGDQKIYVSNIDKLKKDINWTPKINSDVGVTMMIDWISQNKILFEKLKLI